MNVQRQNNVVVGVILILLGVGFLASQYVEGFGEAMIYFLIGGAFMIGYLFRRTDGLLIPAGILMGLGLGSIGESVFQSMSDIKQIGLGVGFMSIYFNPPDRNGEISLVAADSRRCQCKIEMSPFLQSRNVP